MNNVFNAGHILSDKHSTTQHEAFQFIAKQAHKLGFVDSVEGFSAGLKTRESHSSTGFLEGIAIPHCKSSHVKAPAIFVVHFDNPIPWETMDDEAVTMAVSLAIPEMGEKEGLVMLSKLSRALMKPEIRKSLQQRNTQALLKTIELVIA